MKDLKNIIECYEVGQIDIAELLTYLKKQVAKQDKTEQCECPSVDCVKHPIEFKE